MCLYSLESGVSTRKAVVGDQLVLRPIGHRIYGFFEANPPLGAAAKLVCLACGSRLKVSGFSGFTRAMNFLRQKEEVITGERQIDWEKSADVITLVRRPRKSFTLDQFCHEPIVAEVLEVGQEAEEGDHDGENQANVDIMRHPRQRTVLPVGLAASMISPVMIETIGRDGRLSQQPLGTVPENDPAPPDDGFELMSLPPNHPDSVVDEASLAMVGT